MNRINKEEARMYRRKILAIAIPMILSRLVSQLQMVIDRIFLGQLDITCMSAVGNASSPIWTTMNTCFSLAMGSTILISQHIGANKRDEARAYAASLYKYSNILAFALFAVWILLPRQIFQAMGVDASIIEMSVDYARYSAPMFLVIGLESAASCLLQASEQTKILITYGVLRSGVNILLDYVLIFGHWGLPAMGVAGAALATTISEFVGLAVVVVYIEMNKSLWLKPRIGEVLRAKWAPYLHSVKMGLPTALEEFAWNMGNLFLMVMLNRISAVAAGTYTIVFGVELIPVTVFGSLGGAVLTVSGQDTGKGNLAGIGKAVRLASVWSIELSAIMVALFAIFPGPIISLFTRDTAIIAASGLYLLIVGLDLFPKSLNIIIGNGIRGFGDTMWMLKTQIFGTFFVVGMSFLLVTVFHAGIAALCLMVVADEAIRCTMNGWKLSRISSTKDTTVGIKGA